MADNCPSEIWCHIVSLVSDIRLTRRVMNDEDSCLDKIKKPFSWYQKDSMDSADRFSTNCYIFPYPGTGGKQILREKNVHKRYANIPLKSFATQLQHVTFASYASEVGLPGPTWYPLMAWRLRMWPAKCRNSQSVYQTRSISISIGEDQEHNAELG
jgi:hypothetical protein